MWSKIEGDNFHLLCLFRSSGWSIKDGSDKLVETDDGECPSDSTNWIFNDGSTANTPECGKQNSKMY